MSSVRNSYYTAVELVDGEEISTDKEDMKKLAYALSSDNPGQRFAVVKILDVFESEHINKNVVRMIRDKRELIEEEQPNV